MTTENAAFKKVQYAFTAHIRDPSKATAPTDIEDRRMEIYRGLFYRNIQNFVANAFPVLRKLYNDDAWHEMVRNFFAVHQSTTPYFKDISREFLHYLQEERDPQLEDPIFIKELAYYEWLEIHLAFSDAETDMDGVDPYGDLLAGVPMLSPLVQMHSYNYPVHKIKPGFQPSQPSEQPTFLMVYRDKKDKMGFMELNPVTAMLVGLMENNSSKTGQQLLDEVINALNHPNPDAVYKGGAQTLKQLRANDILLGTKI